MGRKARVLGHPINRRRIALTRAVAVLFWISALAVTSLAAADSPEISLPLAKVTVSSELLKAPADGRILLILAPSDSEKQPRFQVNGTLASAQVVGIDVESWRAGEQALFQADDFGYPIRSLSDVPAGEYKVQALLHRYETFRPAHGHTIKLPMDRGEGQQWKRAPGNLYSTPRVVRFAPHSSQPLNIVLDQEIPPIEPPTDTEFIRHVKIKSELLSQFWGRDMHLGAHVLLPKGFDEHPEAHYPLMVFHGHFKADFPGFRTEPPDPDLEPEYSKRFQVEGYNLIQQQEAYDFYRQWISKDFPRFLIIHIQHANPYYDDSYAVNSANLGPYGDAITHELIPAIEKEFRGIGEGWARFLYGGSTGGWEALAAQVFYPDDYNGCFASCPDSIDFRAYTSVNLYEDKNAYYTAGPFSKMAKPGHRDYLGQITATIESYNHVELALGTHSRSGDQYDIWEAVYSPVGDDGYPEPIWNKLTGDIDPEVAEYWREHYDLRHILERDWATLGPKLEGKIRIYCGDMDNYYLNNAVYLMEDFLESTTKPYYDGEVDYGDRDEHCWNGDHENPMHISRLRYNTLYVDKILKRLEVSAPEGADLTSWRYP